jgi:hypothetical protein
MSGRSDDPGPMADPGRDSWQAQGGVLLVLVLLTVLMTWPLARSLGSAVLGPPGDNLEYVWKMWWFYHALVERGSTPFFAPDVFYPFGYPLALSETTLAHTVLGLPLTALWGEVVAYNVLILASFVLSGYGVYRLLRALGSGVAGALVGAVAFAFCPYRFAHLGAGHLPLMGTGWMPLLLWALERLIRRPSWRRGWPVGLFYALTALSSWYYAVMLALFAGLYLGLRARPWRALLWRRGLWQGLAVAGLVAAVLLVPAAWPILRLYGQGEVQHRFSLAYVDQWSASPVDFLYPNAMHSWWGAALTKAYAQNINENLIYLGWVALALAGVGLWRRRGERPVRALAWLGLVAVVLSWGTTLHFAGRPVYLPVPEGVEYQFSRAMYVLTGKWALNKVDYSPLRRAGAIVIPLPTLLLYLFVPAFGAMRVWARFGVMAMLAVALLAGLGADALVARAGQGHGALRRWVLAGALVLAVLLDFSVAPYPYGYTEVRGQPVDRWLASQPVGGPVIHFPWEKTWYGWMLYPARVHGQPIAYGYGTFAPDGYRQAGQVLARFPAPEACALLQEWGVRYVLVGAKSYGAAWPAVRRELEANTHWEEVAVFRDQPLFHGDRLLKLVPPSPAVPATELVSGDRRAYLEDEIHVYLVPK